MAGDGGPGLGVFVDPLDRSGDDFRGDDHVSLPDRRGVFHFETFSERTSLVHGHQVGHELGDALLHSDRFGKTRSTSENGLHPIETSR